MTYQKWNWQQESWPNFTYKQKHLNHLELEFLKESGVSIGVMKHLSEQDHTELIVQLISDEALKTSEIEGEFLNRDSLQSSLLKEFAIGDSIISSGDAREAGIAMMMKNLYTNFDEPLSHESLYRWHDMLMNGRIDVERGKYRTSKKPMQVVSNRIDNPTVHFEAPPYSDVPHEMAIFISWFNNSGPGGKSPLPPLIRAGIAHLYFVSIHPFEDGNGRLGRALVEKSLSQNMGYPTLIALSSTINDKRNDYYAALESQNQHNEITRWLQYFSQTIIQAQQRTIRQVEFTLSKAKFFTTYKEKMNTRQERVVNRMFREGIKGFTGGLSAKNYISIAKTTASTATRDLKSLVEMGALTKTGELKHTRYFLNI